MANNGVVGDSKTDGLLRQIVTALGLSNNSRRCVSVQTTTALVDNTTVNTLTFPIGAQAAILTVEAGAGQVNNSKVIRFWEDGTVPTATTGVPLSNLDKYEITNLNNLINFKYIGVENLNPGAVLSIEYFL